MKENAQPFTCIQTREVDTGKELHWLQTLKGAFAVHCFF